jgi:5'-phosphate synthase pdxT subunit
MDEVNSVGDIIREPEVVLRIGVLALQGDFMEHMQMVEKCGCEAVKVRLECELEEIDGLIIPGGESTTFGVIMERHNLIQPIRKKALSGMPIFGTCAGAIVLAKEIEGSDQPRLSLMDISVRRNAFGRQINSFEADIEIEVLGEPPFRGVFIRAPIITRVGSGVKVLATFEDKIVLAQQDNLIACAFHPELTNDLRLHQYFISLCEAYALKRMGK